MKFHKKRDTNLRMRTNDTNKNSRGRFRVSRVPRTRTSSVRDKLRARARYSRAGFNLVEVVLYVGVLGVLLTVISTMVLGTINNYKTASVKDELASSAYQIFGFFFREAKNAGSVNVSGSVLDGNLGALSLLTPFQFSGATGQVDFYLSGGRIMFKRQGETELVLTPESVEVTRFKFVRVSPKSRLEGVRFYLDLKNKINPEETFSLTTFTMLRGGYAQ